jgi:predicted N-acetyltransferase YhbS
MAAALNAVSAWGKEQCRRFSLSIQTKDANRRGSIHMWQKGAGQLVELVPITMVQQQAVEQLLDAAFGMDRHGRTAYRMRDGVGVIPELSFAAIDQSNLLGTIQCWPVALQEECGVLHAITLVGPVAVDPAVQRGGIGKAMMTNCLNACDALGFDALMMIGDPEYYGRFFGFSAEATSEWAIPGPVERRRLLARTSREGGLPRAGRIIPHPAFATLGLAA